MWLNYPTELKIDSDTHNITLWNKQYKLALKLAGDSTYSDFTTKQNDQEFKDKYWKISVDIKIDWGNVVISWESDKFKDNPIFNNPIFWFFANKHTKKQQKYSKSHFSSMIFDLINFWQCDVMQQAWIDVAYRSA